MKLGTVCYIPPRKIDPSGTFLANLKSYRTRHEIIKFQSENRIPNAPKIFSPETPGDKRRWVVSNLVFLHALRFAHYRRLDYFIYLESDCRVKGNEWDEAMFAQFFASGNGAVMGGSPVCWNPSGFGHQTLKRLVYFGFQHQNLTGMAMPIYGDGQFNKPCLYPNGGGAIFHTATIVKRVFPGSVDNPRHGIGTDAWDRLIGTKLWEAFGDGVIDRFVSLRCAYSGFGNDLIDEEERKRLLTSGERVMCHQIKTDWKP